MGAGAVRILEVEVDRQFIDVILVMWMCSCWAALIMSGGRSSRPVWHEDGLVLDVAVSTDDHPACLGDAGYPVDVLVARLHRAGWPFESVRAASASVAGIGHVGAHVGQDLRDSQ